MKRTVKFAEDLVYYNGDSNKENYPLMNTTRISTATSYLNFFNNPQNRFQPTEVQQNNQTDSVLGKRKRSQFIRGY